MNKLLLAGVLISSLGMQAASAYTPPPVVTGAMITGGGCAISEKATVMEIQLHGIGDPHKLHGDVRAGDMIARKAMFEYDFSSMVPCGKQPIQIHAEAVKNDLHGLGWMATGLSLQDGTSVGGSYITVDQNSTAGKLLLKVKFQVLEPDTVAGQYNFKTGFFNYKYTVRLKIKVVAPPHVPLTDW